MSDIRLRYTGFINFAAQILSIATGLLFVVTVTRNLSTTDFGAWQNIGDLLGYATILSGVVPFSVIRHAARGHTDAIKTGIVANTLLSLPITGVFALFSFFFASLVDSNPLYYQAASLHVIMFYVLPAIQNAVQARKPHALGYGTAVYELAKVSIGVFLVAYLQTGLVGAIVAVVIAQVAMTAFYLISIREYLHGQINWSYLRSWWKTSFVVIYGTVGNRLLSLGMILLILLWGTAARAYVGAAVTFAVIISYSTTLATGLYPKLLAKPDSETVESALRLVLLFAVPMFGGILILSGQLLTVLRIDYAMASIVLYVYAIAYLLDSLGTALDTVILATEYIDMSSEITFWQLMRSKLFFLPTLTYVSGTLYLAVLVVLLRFSASGPIQAAMYTGLAYVSAIVPVFIIRYRTAKKSLPFIFPVGNLVRYALATILMMALLSQINIGSTLSRVMIMVLMGALAYFGIVMVLDSEARALAKDAISIVSDMLRPRNAREGQ